MQTALELAKPISLPNAKKARPISSLGVNNICPFPFRMDDARYKISEGGLVYREDDRTGVIIPRALDYKENRIYARKTAPTGIVQYLPTMRDLPWGAEEEFFDYTRPRGEAKIDTGNNTDVNYAEVSLDEEGERIVTYEIAYRYTQMELDAFNQASQSSIQAFSGNLPSIKLDAALRILQEKEHLLGCYGSADHNLNGMLNHTDVIPNDFQGTFDPYSQTEAVALHNWIVEDIYNTLIRQTTLLTENPNLMLVPQDLWVKFSTTFNTAGNETRSCLTMLRETFSTLGNQMIIAPLNELGTAYLTQYNVATSQPGQDRLMMCTMSEENYSRRISNVRPLPWLQQLKGMSRVLQQRVRGVKFHYPRSATYVDFAPKS